VEPKPPEDPEASLAAFTIPGAAQAIWSTIQANLDGQGVEHTTARFGPRLVEQARCGYLRPTVIHCESSDAVLANTEFMFPFTSVVKCPQEEMFNLGPIPTIKLDWLQPHEGNIVEFLFRPRAFQAAMEAVAV
jgi:hypothetical protein